MHDMKRATITLPDHLDAAFEAYRRDQEVPVALTAVAQAAIEEYLARRGYLPTPRRLRITPAAQGSGRADVTIDHDRYLGDR